MGSGRLGVNVKGEVEPDFGVKASVMLGCFRVIDGFLARGLVGSAKTLLSLGSWFKSSILPSSPVRMLEFFEGRVLELVVIVFAVVVVVFCTILGCSLVADQMSYRAMNSSSSTAHV